MAVFAYARVSSEEQNLNRQLDALMPFIADKKYLFCDKASGKDFNRPAYKSLVGDDQTVPVLHAGDTLVILSIDRLGRNYDEIRKEWERITRTLDCKIKVLDMPLLDTSIDRGLDGKFLADMVLQILSYVAERERINIKRRQREGIDSALSRGVKFGRREVVKPLNWDSTIRLVDEGHITATEAMKIMGLKRTTFYKLLKS